MACETGSREVRAMVLAAGFGTRLRPLTEILPKPLVTILGVSLLEHSFGLLQDAGIKHASINVHHRGDLLRPAIERAANAADLEVTIYEETEILGTGGGLKNAESSLRDCDAILLMNADTVFEHDLRAMIARHFDRGSAATLLLRENPDPVAYPPVETDATGQVRRIAGRPESSSSDGLQPWLFAGAHLLDPRVLVHLPKEGPCDVNRVLHPALITRGEEVFGEVFRGHWWDVGTPRRLLDANLTSLATPPAQLLRLTAQKGIVLDDGVAAAGTAEIAGEVIRSVVGERAVVSAGARVTDSVLFPDACVEAGATVTNSIIGPKTRVPAGTSVDRLLLVGDQSSPVESA